MVSVAAAVQHVARTVLLSETNRNFADDKAEQAERAMFWIDRYRRLHKNTVHLFLSMMQFYF